MIWLQQAPDLGCVTGLNWNYSDMLFLIYLHICTVVGSSYNMARLLNDQVSVRAANHCDFLNFLVSFLNCSQVWIVRFEPILSKVVVVPKLAKTQLFVGNQIKPFEALKMDVASAMAPIGLGCFTVEDSSWVLDVTRERWAWMTCGWHVCQWAIGHHRKMFSRVTVKGRWMTFSYRFLYYWKSLCNQRSRRVLVFK